MKVKHCANLTTSWRKMKKTMKRGFFIVFDQRVVAKSSNVNNGDHHI